MQWPSQSLRTQTLIDTPGIASLSSDTSARAGAFLAPEDAPSQADAVVYLMRHLHATDVRFLESFYDQGVARATPINTIGVLSRADEIGVGRLDALNSARRIARRYRSDDKIRGLCQTVVAVAGLLAQTGRTMRQHEFAALTTLAGLSRAELDGMLLSVDRFARVESDAGHRRPRPAHRAVRAVRGAAGGHADPPGRHRPDRAGGRAACAAAASTTCARCSPRSSPSAASCSRRARRCWPSTWC